MRHEDHHGPQIEQLIQEDSVAQAPTKPAVMDTLQIIPF